ncbi:MAG TPA: bifunctional oligoribonuclease/PAP phosphatase NrnA [Treponemataceae bacterium]|jgi:bifunctional oligoribonuclease and PAP phosphatase NrnA|nr:bifunctional oligoribonuclease/PAP phosphatase NrnA [Treponemataceae bacterium]HQL05403.1 bifunctional oligoribonuclease/PAP phosphatase NrnA [Treponemataceae bacterium]
MTVISEAQLGAFKEFINSHNAFYVTGHKEPDGDCLTSAIGVAKILQKLGKKYQLLSSGPFKRTEIKKYEALFSKTCSEFPDNRKNIGLIIVDCSEFERLGDYERDVKDLDFFILDHHKTSEGASNGIINTKAPATAYIVQHLYEKIIGQIDEETAKILFFGLCTDTGFFRFLDESSTEVFMAAGRLVKSGANPRAAYAEITSGKPFSTRKLLSIMLERAVQKFDGKLIYTYETLEDTRKFGHEGRDSDSLYQMLLSVDNVRAVLFIRQDTEKTCTAGFRSKEDIDVSAIAAIFGGGGHKNAAGLSTTGKIQQILPKILKEFEKIF